MPVNRLGSKPPVLPTDRTSGFGVVTKGANFQGRSVNIAGQRQSEHFLPPEDAQSSYHTISSTNKYIAARNITTASGDENPVSEAHDYEELGLPSHDYEEIGLPPEDEYVEMTPPPDDYEEMNPSSENYVNVAAPSHDYEEIGLPPEDEYVEMTPPLDDYEEMNPS